MAGDRALSLEQRLGVIHFGPVWPTPAERAPQTSESAWTLLAACQDPGVLVMSTNSNWVTCPACRAQRGLPPLTPQEPDRVQTQESPQGRLF